MHSYRNLFKSVTFIKSKKWKQLGQQVPSLNFSSFMMDTSELNPVQNAFHQSFNFPLLTTFLFISFFSFFSYSLSFPIADLPLLHFLFFFSSIRLNFPFSASSVLYPCTTIFFLLVYSIQEEISNISVTFFDPL